MEGTFRLTCMVSRTAAVQGMSFMCQKTIISLTSNDEKCVIFYAAYPHDWKQQAGITFVPGIDPEDMPTPT